MSKLLDLLERVAPHIALFPAWAKRLFVVTLAFGAHSVIVYAGWHDSALRAREASAATRDVTADLTGSGGNDIGLIKRRLASANSERIVDYLNSGGDPTLRITPVNAYLDTIENGGLIRSGDFGGISTADLPLLDLKAANNTKRVVYLTRAVVDVESSRTRPQGDSRGRRAHPHGARVRPRERGLGPDAAGRRPVPHRSARGEERTRAPVPRPGAPRGRARRGRRRPLGRNARRGRRPRRLEADRELAVRAPDHATRGDGDPARAPALPLAGGARGGGDLVLDGDRHGADGSPHGHVQGAGVALCPPGLRSVRSPAGTLVLQRAPEGLGPSLPAIVGIDEELRPGTVKRFEIRVYAPQSSVHRFRVHLVYGTGEILAPPTELHLFVPRTHQTPQPETDVDASRSS